VWTANNSPKAAGAYAKAIESWSALTRQSDDPRFRNELATVYSNRGAWNYLRRKYKAAEPDFEAAIDLLTKLTDEFRSVVAYRELLANTRHNYGLLLRDVGRHVESARVLRASLPLWRRLADDFADRRCPGQRWAAQ
jgi:tetratricopeptide (TPR) repeat protein